MAHFTAPVIQDNPDGWGPCGIPESFTGFPYQPYSKGDKIGKVSEFIKSWIKYLIVKFRIFFQLFIVILSLTYLLILINLLF